MTESLCESVFEPALTGTMTDLQLGDGRLVPLSPARWHAAAGDGDHWLLDRCTGPSIDLGCGPGRLVDALVRRGLPALGVDLSPHAVSHCARRGAPALHGDLFAPLPDEGTWHQVLLADGNIGIGGNPAALLRRCATLLTAGGSVLVELAAPGAGVWSGTARLTGEHRLGPWFPWAVVGSDAVADLAVAARLRVVDLAHVSGRWFAELTHAGRSCPVG